MYQIMWVLCHCGLVGLVPLYHRTFVGPNFLLVGTSWVRRFSRGYFLVWKVFLVGILWVQYFSHGYFVGPKKSIEVHWNELHEVHRSTIFLLYLRRIWRQSVRRNFLAEVRLIHALFIEFHHFMKKIDTAKDWSSQAKHF